MARRKARELAFRTLFMAERSDTPVLEVWDQVLEDLAEEDAREASEEAYGEVLDSQGIEFAARLVGAWNEHRDRIDSTLLESLEGWTFSQMNQSDLNILRLAVAELLFETDVPPEVAMEMAVRQARKFGGDESGKFVNGVLGKIYRHPDFGAKRGG